MKKLILIALNIFLSFWGFAQKIHFTDTSNVWKELEEYNTGGPTVYNYSTYSFIKDTTIDTTDYKWFSIQTGYCSPVLLREDTILNKVYIRECGLDTADTDVVLMDYNLNVGDTFVSYYDGPTQYIVTGIDSTLINGLWYRVWNFSINLGGGSFVPWCSFIEGIGCIQHPAYMVMVVGVIGEYADYMYCFSNNGINSPVSPPISFFDNDTSCAIFPYLSINQLQLNPDKVLLYPNPVSTYLNISATNTIDNAIIINTLGQVVYNGSFSLSHEQVDVSGLPAGVYFVKVNNEIMQKFVKE